MVDTAPKRIKYLQFGILSPQEIVAISEFEATQRDLYKLGGPGGQRIPASNGVLDSRLVRIHAMRQARHARTTSADIALQLLLLQGTSDKSASCETCGQRMADCVGHYAYIRLVLPVFHIGYFKMVITILQDICKVGYIHPTYHRRLPLLVKQLKATD